MKELREKFWSVNIGGGGRRRKGKRRERKDGSGKEKGIMNLDLYSIFPCSSLLNQKHQKTKRSFLRKKRVFLSIKNTLFFTKKKDAFLIDKNNKKNQCQLHEIFIFFHTFDDQKRIFSIFHVPVALASKIT